MKYAVYEDNKIILQSNEIHKTKVLHTDFFFLANGIFYSFAEALHYTALIFKPGKDRKINHTLFQFPTEMVSHLHNQQLSLSSPMFRGIRIAQCRMIFTLESLWVFCDILLKYLDLHEKFTRHTY